MKNIAKYISENAAMLMKEGRMLAGVVKVQRILPVIIIAFFLLGAYITSRTPSKATLPEGFVSIEPDALEARKLRKTATATGNVVKKDNDNDTDKDKDKDGVEGFGDAASAGGGGVGGDIATMNTDRCPNILIQHGSEIFLYNSKVEKVPGVNPIRFKSLDDYSEFMDWLQGRGIRCPILFLQFSYDAQGQAVYKMRPSPTDLQGGLSPNVPYSPAPPHSSK